MKKTISMMSLLLVFGAMSCAQSTPATVLEAFKAKFPKAKSVEWEMENETEWEAEFKLNGTKYSANFTNNGTWTETEHEIKAKDLPVAVKNTLTKDFEGYKIEDVELTESPDFTGYEVELEKGEESMEVVLDASGVVIKKKVKKEEDNDED